MNSAFTSSDLVTKLDSNSNQYGGAFYIKNAAGGVTTNSNKIRNCYYGDVGGGFYLENTVYQDTNSTFSYLSALQGGVFLCKSCTMYLTNSIIANIKARDGGTFYLKELVNVYLTNILVTSSEARQDGGFMYATETTSPSSSNFEFINSITLNDMSAQNNGGTFYLDNNVMDILLSSTTSITNSQAVNNSGGVFYVNRGRKITIEKQIFTNLSAYKDGSFLYSVSPTLVLDQRNSQFTCKSLGYSDSIIWSNIQNSFTTQGGAFYVQNSSATIISVNNTYKSCSVARNGGGFSLINSTLMDQGSTYSNNAALYGGNIYCNYCSIISFSSIIMSNSKAKYGGSIYVLSYNSTIPFSSKDILITDSQADLDGGVIHLTDSSTQTWSMTTTTVSTCKSINSRGGFMFADNPKLLLVIQLLILTDCSATTSTGGIFQFTNIGAVTISSSSFIRFGPGMEGTFLYSACTTLDLTINNSIFKCQDNAFVYNTDLKSKLEAITPTTNNYGAIYVQNSVGGIKSTSNTFSNYYLSNDGAIFHIVNTSLTDTYSTFQNCAGIYGGVIQAEQQTSIVINGLADISSSPTFYNNYGYQGGVFHLKDGVSLTIKNTIIDTNEAIANGGVIYFTDRAGFIMKSVNLIIQDTQIINSKARLSGGSFYIQNKYVTSSSILRTKFINSYALAGNGGVFAIESIGGEFIITDCVFQSFSAPNDQSTLKFGGSLLYCEDSSFSLKITRTTVECYTSQSSLSIENALALPLSAIAGAFYIYNSLSGVKSQSNTYMNCYNTFQGGIYIVGNTTLTDSYSNFYQNQAIIGGIIYSDSANLQMSNSQIHDNYAINGGSITIDNFVNANLYAVSFYNNNATHLGGILYIMRSDIITNLISGNIVFDHCTNIYNNFANKGGFASINNYKASLTIQYSLIWNSIATTQAGLLDIILAEKLTIKKSTLKDFSSPTSMGINSEAPGITITISQSTFMCNSSYDSAYIQELLDLSVQNYTTTTAIYIANAKVIYSTENTFKQCFTAKNGGVFRLVNTQLRESSSLYEYNAGQLGGAISCQMCNMQINKTTFQYNNGRRGGAIHLESQAYMKAYITNFQYNKAYSSAGVIFVSTEAYFEIDDSNFLENQAIYASTIEVLGSSSSNNITISGSTFEKNSANKNTISLMYSYVIIRKSYFTNNLALTESKNIFCGFTTVYVSDCTFRSLTSDNPQLTTGAYFFISMDVNILIQSSLFYNGLAQYGGAIYIYGLSNLTITSCDFKNNYAQTYGGAIYAAGFSKIDINYGTTFFSNLADDTGDDIYAVNTANILTLDNVAFENPLAKTSIYAESVTLVLLNVISKNIQNEKSIQGAALQCINCQAINIENSKFSQFQSQYGSAFYISESENNKKAIQVNTKYRIHNTVFENGKAIVGGALYLSNIQSMTISNCNFSNFDVKNTISISRQSGSGGAIFYTCDFNQLNCRLEITNNTIFKNNSASIQGGAIYWDAIEPIINKNVVFQSNYAQQYGNNIACFAQKISVVNDSMYYNNLVKLGLYKQDSNHSRLLQYQDKDSNDYSTSSTLNKIRSGGILPQTFVALVDKYGQIVGSDFKSVVRVSVDATFTANNSAASKYSPIIEGLNIYSAVGGIAKVDQIVFSGTPGYKFRILFTTEGIDKTKQSNQIYMSTLQVSDIDYQLYVELRECDIGESFSAAGKCNQCEKDYMYSLFKMTQPGDCKKCPTAKAICFGGSNIGPKPGYWRKNNITSNFIKCLYENACLGMLPPDNNPIGKCDTGYQGVMCADCIKGFSRTGEHECSKCPQLGQNIIRLFAIFLGICGLLIFMIRSTLAGATKQINVTGIYLKILMNHIQLILLTSSFKFKWPEQVTKFFDTAKPSAQASTQILSFDCFIDTRPNQYDPIAAEQNDYNRIFFQKNTMLALLPILLLIATYCFWFIRQKCLRMRLFPSSRAISTLVISLFLVHPNIVQSMLLFFQCTEVDNQQRVQEDLEVICWNSSHSFFSYFVAFPSIVVWGLGIPFFALILLVSQRKTLNTQKTKEKYGFLYNGYKNAYFYWEIVIMYRKLILIFISVFVAAYGVMSQAIIVFLVLIIFLILNLKLKPFGTEALSDLETMSLITSNVTVYCGLFFINDTTSDFQINVPVEYQSGLILSAKTQLFFFLVILFANLVFFAYWFYKMCIEIIKKFRKQFEKIYLLLCLCNNKEKFRIQIERQLLMEENDILKQEYDRILNNIVKLHSDGKFILSKQILEKLQVYLDPQKFIESIEEQQSQSIDFKSKKRHKRQLMSQYLKQREMRNNQIRLSNTINKARTSYFGDKINIDEEFLVEGQKINNSLITNTKSIQTLNSLQGNNFHTIQDDQLDNSSTELFKQIRQINQFRERNHWQMQMDSKVEEVDEEIPETQQYEFQLNQNEVSSRKINNQSPSAFNNLNLSKQHTPSSSSHASPQYLIEKGQISKEEEDTKNEILLIKKGRPIYQKRMNQIMKRERQSNEQTQNIRRRLRRIRSPKLEQSNNEEVKQNIQTNIGIVTTYVSEESNDDNESEIQSIVNTQQSNNEDLQQSYENLSDKNCDDEQLEVVSIQSEETQNQNIINSNQEQLEQSPTQYVLQGLKSHKNKRNE